MLLAAQDGRYVESGDASSPRPYAGGRYQGDKQEQAGGSYHIDRFRPFDKGFKKAPCEPRADYSRNGSGRNHPQAVS